MEDLDCCCFHWAEVPLEAQELPLINQILRNQTFLRQFNRISLYKYAQQIQQPRSALQEHTKSKIRKKNSQILELPQKSNTNKIQFPYSLHPFRLRKNPEANDEIDAYSLNRPSNRLTITLNPKFQISKTKFNGIKRT